jgi:hypothetical protein
MANEQNNIQATEQETQEQPRVHGNTRKAADMDLAKKTISPDSYKAVHEGRITLDEARELGRKGSPFGPAPKTVSKNDRSRPCACGCVQLTRGGTWIPGHDARLPGLVMQAVKGEIQLTDEQREHADKRDLFARAEAKITAQKAKAEARAAKKTENQK